MLVTTFLLAGIRAGGADDAKAERSTGTATRDAVLFTDDVLCRGKGVEVKRSQLDAAYVQFKANATVRGQSVSESKRAELEATLLDRLVITQLLVYRATTEDKAKARTRADKFITDSKEQAGSEAALRRQLTALAFTVQEFEAQMLERAICEEVVDRELRSKVKITDEQVKQYYQNNAERLRRPEMVRASHILLSTRDSLTGLELSEAQKNEKKRLAGKVLERARKGEDFAALVKEFSEDPNSKDKGGEYFFARGQMVPEFEAAAFSLQTNQISDLVTTGYGYHIIKLLQRIPPEQIELARIESELREKLTRDEVQENLLPVFVKQIKEEGKLEYLHGARPPEAVVSEGDRKAAPLGNPAPANR